MTRVLSGIVLIALVLTATFLAPSWLFLLVVGLFLTAAFIEYADLAAHVALPVPKTVGAVATLVIGTAVASPGTPVVPLLGAVLISVGVAALGRHLPAAHVPGAVAATVFPALYLGVPLGMLPALREQFGPHAVVFPCLIVAVSDTAQFYVGTAFGRHRLAPAVSPKKSVEGAVGGAVAGPLVAVLYGTVAWPSIGPGWLAAMGLVMTALGIAGDLFESLLKRSAGVKDSSSLIPGHGGVLDRIDALLFVVPGYYALVHFMV